MIVAFRWYKRYILDQLKYLDLLTLKKKVVVILTHAMKEADHLCTCIGKETDTVIVLFVFCISDFNSNTCYLFILLMITDCGY